MRPSRVTLAPSIAIPFDRMAVMQPTRTAGLPWSRIASCVIADSEPDRLRRFGNAEHDGVSDRLYAHSGDLEQSRIHCTAKGADELERGLVTWASVEAVKPAMSANRKRCRRIGHELSIRRGPGLG